MLKITETSHHGHITRWEAFDEDDFIEKMSATADQKRACVAYTEWTPRELMACYGDDREDWPEAAWDLVQRGGEKIIEAGDEWFAADAPDCPSEYEFWVEYCGHDLQSIKIEEINDPS